MRVAIVADSTCDLPAAIVAERRIVITPLHIIWGDQTYTDGVNITNEQFYQRLVRDPKLPKTSQPAPGEFADKFRLARETYNADAVVCVTISQKLSGTYVAAEAARNLVDFPVEVVDSQTGSIAMGFVVLAAADARDQGVSLDGIAKTARDSALRTQMLFAPNTLEFLHRGGRIGGAKRLIGTALNIKPILHVRDGAVEALESVRTRKRVVARLVEIGAQYRDRRPLWLGVPHTNPPDLQSFLDEVRNTLQPDKLITSLACSPVGVHIGPEAIGLAVMYGR
ncbi:MAG: DegV family protein [Anaerolineae bacterium]|nr:DegV family protein [Anaerolineae bacterium]